MERNDKKDRFLALIIGLLVFSFIGCSSSKSFVIQHEPSLEQITAESEETCIGSRLYFFSGRPCIKLKGEKDNNSGVTQYFLRYEIGSFDVDLALGTSLKIGDTWFNLKKSSTDYSNTIVVSSLLESEVLNAIANGRSFVVSYTNRAKTENYTLTGSQGTHLKEGLIRLQRLLESEQKMVIQKK
ncbi:hypothetical protein [Leptospira ilyithenensis]|uniref:hypothetical protein n=1 Tax=Leptospira ilyithenensis TaxID=2484901 RepID=UPI001FE87414|nr:hypothetical protein [Leptospira ilyithenensis]